MAYPYATTQVPAELGLVPRLRILAQSPCPPPGVSSLPGNTDIQTGAVPRASLSPTAILSDQPSPPFETASSRSGADLFQPLEGASVSEGASAASAAVPPQFVSHPEGADPSGAVPYPLTDVSVGLAPHQEDEGMQGIQGVDFAVSPLHAVKPSKSRRQATVQPSSEPVVPVRVDSVSSNLTPATSVSTIDRPRRASAGNWKDGPAKAKDGTFQTIRDKEQRFQAMLSDSQDIGNDVVALKASPSQALKDDKRRGAILKSIGRLTN